MIHNTCTDQSLEADASSTKYPQIRPKSCSFISSPQLDRMDFLHARKKHNIKEEPEERNIKESKEAEILEVIEESVKIKEVEILASELEKYAEKISEDEEIKILEMDSSNSNVKLDIEYLYLLKKVWNARNQSIAVLLKGILPADRLDAFEGALKKEGYNDMTKLKYICDKNLEQPKGVLTKEELEKFRTKKKMILGDLHLWKTKEVITWFSLNLKSEAIFKDLTLNLKDVTGRELFYWQPPDNVFEDARQIQKFTKHLRKLKSTYSPGLLKEAELKEYLVDNWKLSTFIYLDANCQPCLHMENWRHLRSKAKRNEYQPVVCFVGQNRAGKSFFVNQLLPMDSRDTVYGPVQGNSTGDEACSSDIHIFEGKLHPSNRSVTLLDIEGLDGGVPKTRRMHFSRLSTMETNDQIRLVARDTLLYPLAYALADILLYVMPGSGALQGHIKKLQQMTNHVATVSGSFTVLLVLRNFVPAKLKPKKQWDIQHSTSTFLNDVESVPEWMDVKARFHPDKLRVINFPRRCEDPELFIRQLNKLHALLSDTEYLPNEFGGVTQDDKILVESENQTLSVSSLVRDFNLVLQNQKTKKGEQCSDQELLDQIKANPQSFKQLIPKNICVPLDCYYNNKLVTRSLIKRTFERCVDTIAQTGQTQELSVVLDQEINKEELIDEFTVHNIHLTQYDWYSLVEELVVQSIDNKGELNVGSAYIAATRPDNTLISNMSHYLKAIQEAQGNQESSTFNAVLNRCIIRLAGLVALRLQEKRGINSSNDLYFISETGKQEISQIFDQIMSSDGLCAFEPCSFETYKRTGLLRNLRKIQCINNQEGHKTCGGHTFQGGFNITGPFQQSLTVYQRIDLRTMFITQIKEHIAKTHNEIVKSFVHDLQNLRANNVIIAPRYTWKICVVCVRSSSPSILLGCGHRICKSCYEILSGSTSENSKSIQCPIDLPGDPVNVLANEFRIPNGAGVRILCYDGGGVRGELEAMVIKEVHDQSGLGVFESPIKVRDGYDLVVGTSVGALNAVFMNLLSIRPDKILTKTTNLPQEIFPNKFMDKVRRSGKQIFSDKYSPEPLEKRIRKMTPQKLRTATFGTLPNVSNLPRIVVTATEETDSGQLRPAWFGTLVPSEEDLKHLSLIPSSVSLIDGMMASTAAPTYFPARKITKNETNICSFTQSKTGVVTLVDGGISHNNPSVFSLELAERAWSHTSIDFLASISTCMKMEPDHLPQRSWIDKIKIFKWAKSISAYATNSQIVCQNMERKLQSLFNKPYLTATHRKRSIDDFYFRLLDWNAGKIDLDESNPAVLKRMREDAQARLKMEPHMLRITRLAQRLNASMFHSSSAPIIIKTIKLENIFQGFVTIISRNPKDRPVNHPDVTFTFNLLANGRFPSHEFDVKRRKAKNENETEKETETETEKETEPETENENEKVFAVYIPVMPLHYALDVRLSLGGVDCGSISGSPYELQPE